MNAKTGIKHVLRHFQVVRQCSLLLICCAGFAVHSWPQSAAGKAAPAGSSASQNQSEAGAQGFSIESEMLTYRALESNSEAIACDIAAYLDGGTANFGNGQTGSVCTVNGTEAGKAVVIIFPFDQTEFNDFRMWRTDMQVIHELEIRAQDFPCAAAQSNQPVAVGGMGSLASLTPAGSAVSMVQTAFSLLSSETSATSVGGSIQDQAFMDGVARELRSLNVPVLMPSAYFPDSLVPIDASRSPFLSALQKLYQIRRCLVSLAPKKDDSITRLLNDIDAYLASANLSSIADVKNSQQTQSTDKPASTDTQQPSSQGGGQNTAPAPSQAVVASPSHLMAVLSADDLAQKLGVAPETGLLSNDDTMHHILLVKALESGGTIEKHSNVLGTRIRYTGGSVGTYALFTLNGELECSGNVYEYGGSLPTKDFVRGLRDYVPDPSKQFIFQRGSCQAPSKAR